MATVNQVIQGLIGQLSPLYMGSEYLIPDDGNALAHFNATDLHNGTAKIGPAWTLNGSVPFNPNDTPVPSVGPFSDSNNFSLPTLNPINDGIAPFTCVMLIKRIAAENDVSISTYDSPGVTNGLYLQINPGSFLFGSTVKATTIYQAATANTAGLNALQVLIFGLDASGNLFTQLNGGTVATHASSQIAASTGTTYLGRAGLTGQSMQNGVIYEGLFSTNVPSAAAFSTLYSKIQSNASSLPVQIAGGWPSKNHLDDITLGTYSLISIYDGDGTRNTTRWNRMAAAVDTPPAAAGVTATLNKPSILPGGTATVTLTGTPNNNDGVAFGANPPGVQADVLASALAMTGESLTTLAAALAASITSGAYNNGKLTATSSLGVVTVTNTDTVPYGLAVGTANIGSRLWENRRVERHLRCIVWTNSDAQRQAVGDPLDAMLAQLENYFGFALPNGEWVRLKYLGDTYGEGAQEGDVYRRDFRISLEYGVTQTELLYPVLVGSLTFTP